MKKAYTDYPITELGDIPGQIAPVRKVEVIGYDGDKYCLIRVSGHLKEVKWGYLYTTYGRNEDVSTGEIEAIKTDDLPYYDLMVK